MTLAALELPVVGDAVRPGLPAGRDGAGPAAVRAAEEDLVRGRATERAVGHD